MKKIKIIARIYTGFHEKFGIPRQSGIVGNLAKIVFEEEYRVSEALRGIEGFSHLWLIWQFSLANRETWTPTVRPPRLGGNKRMGVFATRAPYRPNPIGLSSVELVRVEHTESEGDILIVRGADILDGTPIYDIKPYLAYTDSHPEAVGGFSDGVRGYSLEVFIPEELDNMLADDERKTIRAALAHDPRPQYHSDEDRVYGMSYLDYDIRFTVRDGALTVTEIVKK